MLQSTVHSGSSLACMAGVYLGSFLYIPPPQTHWGGGSRYKNPECRNHGGSLITIDQYTVD